MENGKWKMVYLMNFKQFSALMILNGRSRRRVKKCLFSVTKASAPVHSTYAAIKASADFRPIASYLAPNANGIKLSSSILVKSFMKSINSLNASGVKFLLISSTIKRGIRRVSLLAERTIFSSTFSHKGSRAAPRAKIYMLLSSTRSKLRLPEFFPNFADFVNNFLFVFPFVSGARFGHNVANSFKPHLCFSYPGFYHHISPLMLRIPHQTQKVKVGSSCQSSAVSYQPSAFSCQLIVVSY